MRDVASAIAAAAHCHVPNVIVDRIAIDARKCSVLGVYRDVVAIIIEFVSNVFTID